MSSKQALMQEIDTLPQNDIEEVSAFISFLKFKSKAQESNDVNLDNYEKLIKMIHSASDEPMPLIEPLRLREVES